MIFNTDAESDESGSSINAAEHWDDRTIRLIGREAAERLAGARVLIVGVGGVGGYAAEMLARSGVGHLTLVDSDEIAPSNLNRQIIATRSSLGMKKVLAFAERIHEINAEAEVEAICDFITPDNAAPLLDLGFDFVLDAIDTVAPKTALIAECMKRGIPIISSMGAGGRLDPSRCRIGDIWDTREDGLARAVRQRLKRMGLRRKLTVVCSDESPHTSSLIMLEITNKRSSYGTLATIPSIFGILMASHAIRKIAQI